MSEKDLGYRRVQCTGRGSYIISLPKEYVEDLGLSRGSEIAFNIQPDSTLNLFLEKSWRRKAEKTAPNQKNTM